VRVAYSALTYKDGLASQGHSGVARKFPLVLGIDAVGEVIASEVERFSAGDQVLIAHAKFGTAHDGGFAAYVRVPADWVYVLPTGLTPKEAVTLGTAGFTAAQSVEQIVKHEIVSKLGYRVVASSGKKDKHQWLIQQGAAEVITRQQTLDESATPLLKGRWAAAIDTVGGATLVSVIRSAKRNACVTACGLVAGHELGLTVYPFILRGVTLCGIDSANVKRETRTRLWNKIATQWMLDVTGLTNDVTLEELPDEIERILAGKVFGRTIIKMP
jgi:NADPH:quinone reductase-like Zn-dependent oxidoreductase